MADDEERDESNVVHMAANASMRASVSDDGILGCRHINYVVDRYARLVLCRTCKAKLDPVDVLHDYASGERDWHYWKKKTKVVEARVRELEEEERKTKARLRNAKKKDADHAVARERQAVAKFALNLDHDIRDIAKRVEAFARKRPVGVDRG